MEKLANNLPREKIMYPFMPEATVEPIDMFKVLMSKFSALMDAGLSNAKFQVDAEAVNALQVKTEKENVSIKSLAETEDIYPYMLCMAGSGFGFMKVNIYSDKWIY